MNDLSGWNEYKDSSPHERLMRELHEDRLYEARRKLRTIMVE